MANCRVFWRQVAEPGVGDKSCVSETCHLLPAWSEFLSVYPSVTFRSFRYITVYHHRFFSVSLQFVQFYTSMRNCGYINFAIFDQHLAVPNDTISAFGIMVNYWYSLLLVTVTSDGLYNLWRRYSHSAFGIMCTHVRHLSYLMVSEVTATKTNEYQ